MSTDRNTALPGPHNILRKQFPNGVTVLVHENPRSGTAALCGSLCAGTAAEPPDKTGLAAFVSASLTAGTRSRDGAEISGTLEGIGAVLSFEADPYAVRFRGKCLGEDLPGLLKLLKEALAEPVFPEPYLEYLRRGALAGYCPDTGDIEDVHRLQFRKFLWGEDHPCGRPYVGTDEVIRSITREDLLAHHRRFFGPKNLILALAGSFRGQEVLDRCGELFGSWEKAQEEPDEDLLFPEPERHDCFMRQHVISSRTETSILLGTFGPAECDPDILAAGLGNSILGGFGMMGRLGRAVRTERGLAYSVFSSLSSGRKCGTWTAEAQVDPKNLAEAGDLILEELDRFSEEPVSLRELEDARSLWVGSLPLRFRTNAGMAEALHDLAFYRREPDHYLRLPGQLAAVTPETVLEAARKWIGPSHLVILTSGPDTEDPRSGLW